MVHKYIGTLVDGTLVDGTLVDAALLSVPAIVIVTYHSTSAATVYKTPFTHLLP